MHPKLAKAINHIIFRESFLGSLLPRLAIVQDDSIPTMATNGVSLFWSEPYVEAQNEYVLRADVAHEIFHCVLIHAFRRGSRDPKKWNYACDYSINPFIARMTSMRVDETFLLDEKRFPLGTPAEIIYDQLTDEEVSENKPQCCTDAPEAEVGSAKADELDWQGAIAVAMQNAKAAGSMSLALEKMITRLFEPKLPWIQLLYAFLVRPKKKRQTYNKFNRHYRAHNISFPGYHKEKTGSIVLAYDVSGSMSDTAIVKSLTEVAYIVNEIHPESVILIEHDSNITDVQTFGPNDELPTKVKIHGRGGTDFNPVFSHINGLDQIPDAVILFTDGYGPHPKYAPEYPVLWVLVETNPDVQMNFGEHIWLDP